MSNSRSFEFKIPGRDSGTKAAAVERSVSFAETKSCSRRNGKILKTQSIVRTPYIAGAERSILIFSHVLLLRSVLRARPSTCHALKSKFWCRIRPSTHECMLACAVENSRQLRWPSCRPGQTPFPVRGRMRQSLFRSRCPVEARSRESPSGEQLFRSVAVNPTCPVLFFTHSELLVTCSFPELLCPT